MTEAGAGPSKTPVGVSSTEWRGAWRAARPELVIASIALTATATTAYVVAQSAAATAVVVAFTALALAVLSRLAPRRPASPSAPDLTTTDRWATAGRSLTYWQLHNRLRDGIASRSAYEANLGPYLQHLLAARLSERHNVNLYREPEAARRLLCRGSKDLDLWPWVEPERPRNAAEPQAPGLPARALSRLVRRMEQL